MVILLGNTNFAYMNKSNKRMRISITILPSLNKLLEEMSKSENISKSSLIEKLVSMHLKERVKSETKKLSQMVFSDLPSEEEWQLLQNI